MVSDESSSRGSNDSDDNSQENNSTTPKFSSTTVLVFPTFESYTYRFPIETISQIHTELELDMMSRADIVVTLHSIMEHIEVRFLHLDRQEKKHLAFDTLFCLGEKNGLAAVDLDTLMISSIIDIIAHIGKHGTKVNRSSLKEKKDQSINTDDGENNTNNFTFCFCS